MATNPPDPRPAPPIVRYAPLGELRVYELSEGELNQLASGPPGSQDLNFALAMLPAALAILLTLTTTTIGSDRLYQGYWVAFWLLTLQGVYFLVRWLRSGKSHRQLIAQIRERMPVSALAEQIIALEATGTSLNIKSSLSPKE